MFKRGCAGSLHVGEQGGSAGVGVHGCTARREDGRFRNIIKLDTLTRPVSTETLSGHLDRLRCHVVKSRGGHEGGQRPKGGGGSGCMAHSPVTP